MLQVVSVLLIENERTIREKLAAVIRCTPDLKLLLQSASVEDSIIRVSGEQPNVVLLDIDLAEENEQAAIERLIKAFPSAGIICISQKWDETTARQTILAGASGYLIKPFRGEELLETIRAIDNPRLLPVSEIITLISPKGRCGKTTVAVNLAIALWQLTGERVGIIDADLQFGDVSVLLNLNPSVGIVEAARDLKYLSPIALGAYLTDYNKHVKILAPAQRPEQAELVKTEDIPRIVSMMRMLFRYVIVDTASGWTNFTQAAVEASDYTFVINECHLLTEGSHLDRLINYLQQACDSNEKIKVIVNRIPGQSEEYRKKSEAQLSYTVAARLPNDFPLVARAISRGKPLAEATPESPIMKEIMQLAQSIANCKAV